MTEKDYIAEALTSYWGERCKEYAAGCPCCDAWAQYDAIREAALREARMKLLSIKDAAKAAGMQERLDGIRDADDAILALIDKKEG